MVLYSVEAVPGREVECGPLIFATAVTAANIIKDFREKITNTLGGRMMRYEELVEGTVARALETLEEKASAGGFDGVLGVRIGHPSLVEGGVEVVVYGTPFRFLR